MNFILSIRPYMGRIICTIIGIVAAILLLTIGFWPTLLMALLGAVGYMVGLWRDGSLELPHVTFPTRH